MAVWSFYALLNNETMKSKQQLLFILIVGMISLYSNCSKSKKPDTGNNPPTTNPVTGGTIDYWVTTGNQFSLLQKQLNPLSFNSPSNSNATIEIDSTSTFQSIDGFGYSLTGGSAYLINQQLPADKRSELLQELFGPGANSIGVSYLRISIGASDLDATVFSYNDLPAGQTDPNLDHFNLSIDTLHLIPVLKQILAINPNIKIMGSPWSPPVWMKDNGNSKGGSLLPQYYSVYAKYFVKYIQAMKAKGITIDAITPQNEPQHGGNNPSMVMSALQQADFIKNHLGPAFQAAGINTKIIIWDHNCDNPQYPITVLNDAGARPFINGTAFHLYGGDESAFSAVHNAYPDKNLYFTEQWTGANEPFNTTLKWHLRHVVIGTIRNWSKIVLEWNLASDPTYNPHTPGGCTECKGAVTIGNNNFTRNISYYIIGHAAKFVSAGSVRIASNNVGDVYNVAFLTPDGRKVLLVVNDGSASATFNIKYKGKWAAATLEAGAVATYVW
jgi:glucosylceramidase